MVSATRPLIIELEGHRHVAGQGELFKMTFPWRLAGVASEHSLRAWGRMASTRRPAQLYTEGSLDDEIEGLPSD